MRIVDRGTVYDATQARRERRFCAWTSPAILADGRLLVSFHCGSAKQAPDENVLTCRSEDAGKSWQIVCHGLAPLTVDGVPGSWHDGKIAEIEPGHLLGAFWWLDRSDPSRPMCNPDTTGTLPCRIFVMDSFDAGQTWVNRREVDTHPFEAVALMGQPLRLAGGEIAVFSEAWKTYYDAGEGEHHAVLSISHDGGWTFEQPIVVANDPANVLLFWDQRLTVDPATGRLVGMFWTHDRRAGQDRDAHIAWGSPDGKMWSYPVDAGFAGQIPCPLVLPDGRLLAVYVHRHYPPSLRAIISSDYGKTWDVQNELIYYEKKLGGEAGMEGQRQITDYYADMAVWSFGHTEARRLPDGDVFVSYYAGDAESLSVHWARLGT